MKIKIMYWNVFGGQYIANLKQYIKENPADIYCFQEVFHLPVADIDEVISQRKRGIEPLLFSILSEVIGAKGYFSMCDKGHDYLSFADHIEKNNRISLANKRLMQGNAIYVKNKSFHTKFSEHVIHDSANERLGLTTKWKMQLVELNVGNKNHLTIGNVRGMWSKDGKNDNQFRLLQSMRIADILKNYQNNLIIGGDFNLLPNSKSLEIIKNIGLVNQIEINEIQTTRSKLYNKSNPWADYCFTSKDVTISSFEVPDTDASDHRPMIVELHIPE